MRIALLVVAVACSKPEPHWCAYAKPGGPLPTTCKPSRAECEEMARNLAMFYDPPCVQIAPVFCFANRKGGANCYPTQRDCIVQYVDFFGDQEPDDACLAR